MREMSTLRRALVFVASAALVLAVASAPAQAARTGTNLSLFGGGNGSASWTPAVSNDADPFSVQLSAPGPALSGFAGITIHFPAPIALASLPEPSFDFMADVSSASGGSPRMVLAVNDNGVTSYPNLRPLSWTAGVWANPAGGVNWDNQGGTCGFLYAQTYTAIKACHSTGMVTAAFIVTDSDWLISPYTNYIDNVQFNGCMISKPSDNNSPAVSCR